ncbi:unnamed protein product [Rotaria sp. Silwood1]|nr:unnamed protein product [Rotaria sp. Silwood1]
MATSTSANPHNSPNERIENIARKRKISSITFFAFGILLIISGSLLASLESQRFSVSFIIFGIIGLIFAFMYWISAEKILIELRKFNAYLMRQAQLQAQNSGAIYLRNINNRDVEDSNPTIHVDLPSYEQSVVPQIGLLPSALAILPASGIELALYETLKRRIESYQGHVTNPLEKLIVGNISNSISQFFIYPLLNVRTRLQSNIGQSDTMTQILKRLWLHHGLRGLYNGFSLHMLRLAPASGISYLTFEYTSKLLGAKAL